MVSKEKIEEVVRGICNPQSAEFLIRHLRPCIVGSLEPLDSIPVGGSKIGGEPDLPREMEYPIRNGELCEFLLQLNFAETLSFALEGLLPKDGLLSIFCKCYFDKANDSDPFLEYPETKDQFFCIYTADVNTLERKAIPSALLATSLVQHQIGFHSYWTMPRCYDPLTSVNNVDADIEEEVELWDQIRAAHGFPSSTPELLLLSHAIFEGISVLEHWKVFLSQIPLYEWATKREQYLDRVEGVSNDFIPLIHLKVKSKLFLRNSGDGGWGDLNIGIPKTDLLSKNFENAAISLLW